MLRAIAGDAVFIAAIFFETLAGLSILQASHTVALPEAFEPVLTFYREQALPVLAPGATFLRGMGPRWLADASIIASVLAFLFFIAQAREAMSPLGDAGQRYENSKAERIEALLDWALPAAFCAFAALITAPLLLPFLTLPAAIVIEGRRLLGSPSWFNLSPAYFVNILILGFVFAVIFALFRQI